MASIEQLKASVSRGRGFARSNSFVVTLPSLGKYDTTNLNVICSNVNLPGRQILTQERLIGIKGRKMPSGFASDDVSMIFYVMNDYLIKEYFANQLMHSSDFKINLKTGKIDYINSLKYGKYLSS